MKRMCYGYYIFIISIIMSSCDVEGFTTHSIVVFTEIIQSIILKYLLFVILTLAILEFIIRFIINFFNNDTYKHWAADRESLIEYFKRTKASKSKGYFHARDNLFTTFEQIKNREWPLIPLGAKTLGDKKYHLIIAIFLAIIYLPLLIIGFIQIVFCILLILVFTIIHFIFVIIFGVLIKILARR